MRTPAYACVQGYRPGVTWQIWNVPAEVVRIVDGDTLILDLDLGWHVSMRGQRCRLAFVNAPEMNTPEGRAARDWVVAVLPLGTVVRFVSHSLDKYGRPLGAVILPDSSDLGLRLLAAGHAVKA